MLTTPVAESGKLTASLSYNWYSVHTCELEYIGGGVSPIPHPQNGEMKNGRIYRHGKCR